VLPSGVKAPASMVFAKVIETVGEASFESISQDCAWSPVARALATRAMRESNSPAFMIGTISRHLSLRPDMPLLPCDGQQLLGLLDATHKQAPKVREKRLCRWICL
jgi:hypothetical protein